MNILIIDDDEKIRNVLSETLAKEKHTVFTAEDGLKGLNFFENERIDICFLDLWMPNLGGIETLQKIKENYTNVEIIMISGEAKIDHAVKATKFGAFDFIEKPLSVDKILSIVNKIQNKNIHIDKIINKKTSKIDLMIGDSPKTKILKDLIENAAKNDARILITGENGTGKELVAKKIHIKSQRSNKPFIGVNCAAIPETLIEAELFGHVKGAFTGATNDRIGKFELSNGGTLFLDEIADMSLPTQAKVLRVLQEMKITKIGSTEQIDIDVRIIAATNKDIKEEIKKGNFRDDLYYRLNVIPINIPPLRERKEDIPLLINYFMKTITKENNLKEKNISKQAMNYIINYPWPGNIRQLRNIIERLIIMIEYDEISLNDIEKCLENESLHQTNINTSKYENYKLNAARDEFEKDFIENKLIENKFNISKTAKVLGIYPSNLHSKINKLGISIDELKKS